MRQAPDNVTEEMSVGAKAAAASGCNAELWDHVYRKTRLRIVEGCIAVTGTIRHIKRETDGDDHIQLAVDPEFAKLLNERNRTAQGDTLILEPICQGPVTQADAEAACHDFHSPVDVPNGALKFACSDCMCSIAHKVGSRSALFPALKCCTKPRGIHGGYGCVRAGVG